MATQKQKEAMNKIMENRGMPISTAMLEVGYKPKTAKNPKNLTESDGWLELMDKYLPEKDLAKVHKEGLQAGKHVFKNNNETGEIEDLGIEPDYPTRHKYLDTAYKLKGLYAPEKNQNVNVNVDVKQNKETIRQIAQEVIKKLRNEQEIPKQQ